METVKKRKKKRPSDIVCSGIVGLILTLLALVCILPMWHVLMSAISAPKELYATSDFLFLPVGGISFEAWSLVWENYPILRSFFNTVFYTAAYTAIGLILTLLAAYVLSRKDFMWRTPLLVIFIIPMFVNAGMIPQYIVIYNLHLTNTIWSIILPGCCTAMSILMVRVGMTATDSYCEAAEIDGAGHLRTLFEIVLPLVIPYVSVVLMFSVITQWNSWMLPKIYLSKEVEHLYPLSLVIYNMIQQTEGTGGMSIGINKLEEYGPSIQMVTILISSLPLLIVYPFIQKFFERAVIIGGVKG